MPQDTAYIAPASRRVGGLALITDEANRVLLVRPTYNMKDDGTREDRFYQLPGGSAQRGETDWDACQREVWEETGLSITPGALLVKDYMPVTPTAAEGYNFVYDCGKLTARQIAEIRLPEAAPGEQPELDAFILLAPEDLAHHTEPYQQRRIEAAMAARIARITANLYAGTPIRSAA
ncbi:NUDIX hydrolase [Streptomyces sp. ME19-01-6]|uniref:NUDIX hydrolase n=1 Tax=Streptomyces sp. ME19-01-6 TaxID=3028686 RepID=UPI0029A92A62|nr:NUDIX hydrolase [Streptomyces sp. ME19-01-6]MDX3224500.1 NUDIX hydrolase [Streptomyces sp. ME19-01-6]